MKVCQNCNSPQSDKAIFCDQCGIKFDENRPEYEILNGTLIKYNGENTFAYIPKEVTRIGNYAFASNKKIEKVIIPEGVEHLMEGAFIGCDNLKEVSLPSTLKIIDSNAFWGCSMQNIDLPEGLTHINGQAFYKCLSLTEIKIPKSVYRIEREAFAKCDALESVYFNAELVKKTYDKSDIFADSGIKNGIKVVIGKDVKEVPSYIFAKSRPLYPKGDETPSSIVKVEFEQGSKCKVIREGAFYNCKNLNSLDLPNGLREIHAFAFYHCEKIKITFPETIKSIKESAFCDCTLIDAPKDLPITDWK